MSEIDLNNNFFITTYIYCTVCLHWVLSSPCSFFNCLSIYKDMDEIEHLLMTYMPKGIWCIEIITVLVLVQWNMSRLGQSIITTGDSALLKQK